MAKWDDREVDFEFGNDGVGDFVGFDDLVDIFVRD